MTDELLMEDGDEMELEIPEEEISAPIDYGSVTVFFHTGGQPVNVRLAGHDVSLTELRQTLREQERNTDGLAAIVDGRTVVADYESSTALQAGNVVVFSGSVKGG